MVAKFQERGLENVELLDIMFKYIAAIGDLAWAPSSCVLLDDVKKPTKGLSDISTDSSSPKIDDDDVDEAENPNLSTQVKGKK